MFRYKEGQRVAIRESRSALGLKAGDTGGVWAIYDLESPEYEVTFHGPDGSRFDVTLTDEELMGPLLPGPQPARRQRKEQPA